MATASDDMFVNVALKAWDQTAARGGKIFSALTEEQLLQQIAPGKNRLIYLWGHLIAVNDALIAQLGLGERLYSQWDAIFIKSPDGTVAELPSALELKSAWDAVNANLATAFAKLTPSDWLARHTLVSEEDFANEPHRNRFALLLSRTSHIAYHLGQAVLVKH